MVSGYEAGSILADRYRLESLLGQGGMGSVWRALHLTLNSPVAIKLIDPSIAASENALARFLREAQAAAALRSPHVVQTLDYGVHDGIPFIAMELMEGESLADRLKRVGRLSPAETAKFLMHVARAVGKAHDAGIVHRDLKPDNIFLVHNDDDEVAKVLDFGIAKQIQGLEAMDSQTQTGAVMGTPFYMSPEQAEGTKALDHRTDLWAIGVIAYECLLGQLPFQGTTIGELIIKICTKPLPVPSQAAQVPVGFDDWFARACAREPVDRFENARQQIEAFRMLVTQAAGVAPFSDPSQLTGDSGAHVAATTGPRPITAPGTEAPVVIPTNPTSWVAIAAVLVGVLAIGAVGAVALLGRKAPDEIVEPADPASAPSAEAPAEAVPAEPNRQPREEDAGPATSEKGPPAVAPAASASPTLPPEPRTSVRHRPPPKPTAPKPEPPPKPTGTTKTDFGF